MHSLQDAAPIASRVVFSPQERAQYVELVNDKLRSVQIHNQRMFSVFARALDSLLHPNEPSPALEAGQEGIADCVEDITEMLKSPEMYAKPEHFEEFRLIVRDRVAAKIAELTHLADDEKDGATFREQQQKTKKEAEDNLKTMREAHAPLPGSAAYVLSVEETLRQQMDFLNSLEQGRRGVSLVRIVHFRPVDRRSITEVEQGVVFIAADIFSRIWNEQRMRLTNRESRRVEEDISVQNQVMQQGEGNINRAFRDIMASMQEFLLRDSAQELRLRQQNARP